jgi:hypothetical protein
MNHELTAPTQLQYPGGKDGMWQVTCSCGYRTTPRDYPGHAERDARAHQKAKTQISPG